MTNKSRTFFVVIFALLAVCAYVWAQPPNGVSYSSRLTDPQGEPIEGQFNMTFRIYDSPLGGTLLHQQAVANVVVRKGQFNVLLGPFNSNVFLEGGGGRYVEVQVGTNPPLLPRQQLISVPFAQRTASIEGARGGSIAGGLNVSGNVGIGTASPTGKLGVDGNLTFEVAANDVDKGILWRSGTDPSWGRIYREAATGRLHINSQTGTALTLNGNNATGNVGIGTTSPTGRLGVDGSITFEVGANNVDKGLLWRNGTDPSWGRIYRETTTGKLQIDSQTGSALTLNGNNTTGNVGIGTTAPGNKLDVAGAITATGANAVVGANRATIDVLPASGYMRVLSMGPNGATRGGIRLAQTASDGSLYLESLTVDPSGNISVAGNINAAGEVLVRGQNVRNFGGAFSYSGPTCLIANPFTGGCSCPAGFAGVSFVVSNGRGLYTITMCMRGGRGSVSKTSGAQDLDEDPAGLQAESPPTARIETKEGWLEDFGSARLIAGVAVVKLSSWLAEQADPDTYRVFPIPNGDCNGLYVTEKTPTSFSVRELRGGAATIDFDYRIVARRKASAPVMADTITQPDR